jgi:hypothetical protein
MYILEIHWIIKIPIINPINLYHIKIKIISIISIKMMTSLVTPIMMPKV